MQRLKLPLYSTDMMHMFEIQLLITLYSTEMMHKYEIQDKLTLYRYNTKIMRSGKKLFALVAILNE